MFKIFLLILIVLSHMRFLLVVLSAYKQMQSEGNQRTVGDIKVDDFQNAFTMFRPSES